MEKQIKVTPLYFDYVLNRNYKVIIQVGGRFSSKSYNSEIEMAVNLASKDKYKLLVIEDLEGGLTKGYYAGLKDKIEQFEQDRAYSMIKSPVQITNLINKNMALFSGYATEQQKKAVKAIDQVTAIVVEEGEWLLYDDFVALIHQLRGGKAEDRKLTILMNPVNPDCFVNEMFIETPPDKVIAYFPNTNRPKVFEKNITTVFEYNGQTITDITKVLIVLSTHHDNPYLTIDQRASIEKLKETDNEKYLQLGEARFIRSTNVFFGEFKREIHVIEPFIIPEQWKRYRVLDYALDMLACYWVAVDYQGKAYFYKELYEDNLIISQASKRIIEMTNEPIYQTLMPSDLLARNKETGRSHIEIFQENGIYASVVNNRRIPGLLDLKEWLAVYETKDVQTGETYKTANLVFFSNCTNAIRCMGKILKDEKDPNDIADKPHELTHSVTAAIYFAAGRPRPPRMEVKKKQGNWMFETQSERNDLDIW